MMKSSRLVVVVEGEEDEEEKEEEEEEAKTILLHWEDLILQHLLLRILNRMPTAASEVVQPRRCDQRCDQMSKTNHLTWWAGGGGMLWRNTLIFFYFSSFPSTVVLLFLTDWLPCVQG